MPIVEYIPVHSTPMQNIEYIINGDKTDEMRLVTGINCLTDAENAYQIFKYTFEKCTREKFNVRSVDGRTKSKIRIHHYVQSFSPDEQISPEQANAIGVEWAKKAFGEDYQIIVATHVDKNHIHNHIALCPYSLTKEHWNANYTTLKKVRKISDEICKQYGIGIIENPQHKNTAKYAEWLARQNGTSWKAKIAEKIDTMILREDINNIEDLAEQLRNENYIVRLGKYMTIQLATMNRGIRSYRLGDGYDVEELKYRILHKEREISKAAISKFSGTQKIYALYMRQLQIQVFHHKSKRVTYADLTRSANLLTYLTQNNITSVDELKESVDISNQYYLNSKDICKYLEKQISKEQNPDAKKELEKKLEEEKMIMSDRKAERDRVAGFYKTYLNQTSDNAFEQIMKEVEEEHNYIQQELSKEKNQRNTDNISEEKNL